MTEEEAHTVDIAARFLGSVQDRALIVGEINDPMPDGPTRECVVLLDPRIVPSWAWAIRTVQQHTDARGVPLILACRMYAEACEAGELCLAR